MFFKMIFDFPLCGGDEIEFVTRVRCSRCGLQALPFALEFPVPDDFIKTAVVMAETAEDVGPKQFFTAEGLLLATSNASKVLFSAGITGISSNPVRLLIGDRPEASSEIEWLKIFGRCSAADLWTRVISKCSLCGMPIEEPIAKSTRIPHLLANPSEDVSHARERSVGIIVSSKFKRVAESIDSTLNSYVRFEQISIP
jgi:hypothetical protein